MREKIKLIFNSFIYELKTKDLTKSIVEDIFIENNGEEYLLYMKIDSIKEMISFKLNVSTYMTIRRLNLLKIDDFNLYVEEIVGEQLHCNISFSIEHKDEVIL